MQDLTLSGRPDSAGAQPLVPFAQTIEQVMAQYYPPRKMVGRAYWPDLSEVQGPEFCFFSYPFSFILTAFQTLQLQQTVRGRYFIWGLTGSGFTPAGVAAAFSVQLKDGRTTLPFMEESINSASLVGTAQQPYFLLDMHVVPSRRPLSVEVTDQSGSATGNLVQVCLMGVIDYSAQ
jgi:hypothetical protein